MTVLSRYNNKFKSADQRQVYDRVFWLVAGTDEYSIYKDEVKRMDDAIVSAAFDACKRNKRAAAKAIGINRGIFSKKLSAVGIIK